MKIKTPFTSAIIVAAGKGTRMNSVTDKLMAEIHGKPVLQHTIDAFQDVYKRQVFQQPHIHCSFLGTWPLDPVQAQAGLLPFL